MPLVVASVWPWKANRRLTLNYGVRWEPYLSISYKQGKMHFVDQQPVYSVLTLIESPAFLRESCQKPLSGHSAMTLHLRYTAPLVQIDRI